LAADSGYASAEIPFWLVHEHGIEPHIPASMSSGARTGPSNGTTPATARLNVDRRRELGDLKMIMSVVKSLAHMALGTLLIAIGPASMSVSDAQDLASAHGDMPIKQLKDVYLDCDSIDPYNVRRHRLRPKVLCFLPALYDPRCQ
jgi:hypothetical protein